MPVYNLHKHDDEGNESPQWGFANSRAQIQVFGGAYANGKTTASVVTKALRLVADYPGSNGLIARATYPKLNDTIKKVFMEWCPPAWIKRKPTQDDNTCYMVNGSVVNFRYLSQRGKQSADGSTTSNLLSATYDYAIVDQIEDPEITHKDFLDLVGRLRGTTTYRPVDGDDPTMPSTGPRWLVMTANPTANWFYKEIIQPYHAWQKRGVKTEKLLVSEATGLPIMELFEGSTYTNKANLPADYLRTMEATYKGQQRERYLMGKWTAYEGLVYGHFDKEVNVITREQALEHIKVCKGRYVQLKVREGYDFGLVSPTCYGFAFVDDHGRVILLDGFYKPNFFYTEHANAIKEIRAKYYMYGLEAKEPIYADPDVFRKKVIHGRSTGTSIAQLLTEDGLTLRPANNDIATGIAKMNAYINGLPDVPHVVTGVRPGPLFYVVEDLDWWFTEVDSYYWRRSSAGTVQDNPTDENDHAMDMTKYMLSKLPDPSEIVIPAHALPPGWMKWQEAPDQPRMDRM